MTGVDDLPIPVDGVDTAAVRGGGVEARRPDVHAVPIVAAEIDDGGAERCQDEDKEDERSHNIVSSMTVAFFALTESVGDFDVVGLVLQAVQLVLDGARVVGLSVRSRRRKFT